MDQYLGVLSVEVAPEPDPVALAVEATTTTTATTTATATIEPTLDQAPEPVPAVAAEPLEEAAAARVSTTAGMTLADRVLADLALAEVVLDEVVLDEPTLTEVVLDQPTVVEVGLPEPIVLPETPSPDLSSVVTPSPVSPVAAPTPAPRSSAPGRRKATTRASIRPARATRTKDRPVRSRRTEQKPARRSGGSHASHAAPVRRRSPLRRLPSVPMLIGIAALVMSAGGAITAANNASDYGYSPRYSQASALTGVSDVTRVNLLDPRDTQVSRDSSRETASSGADPTLVNLAKDQAKDRTETLTKFAQQAQATSARIKRNLWLIPTSGYHLTARFGDVGLWQHFHTGLDFAAPAGTPIVSIAEGVVTSAGYDGAYGNKTVITLTDGTEIWYCHQTSIYVNVGETVKAGQQIGTVGYTGHTTGSHLHIEVRPGGGDPVDPYAAFLVHGATP